MNTLVEKALTIAHGELGVREAGGANRGARVEVYQKTAHCGPGDPWCACFVFTCTEWAAQALSVPNPFPRTGYCPHIANWAAEEKLLLGTPAAGDVFLRYGVNERGQYVARHTGFVVAADAADFQTCEGNSNPKGGREGYGVFNLTRHRSGPYKFVRWGARAEPVSTYMLAAGGQDRFAMMVVGGRSMVPITAWAKLLGFTLDWDHEAQAPRFNGKEVPVELTMLNGVQAAPLRDLAEWSGLKIEVDEQARRVTLSR
jgi:hypothetical protein